MKPSITQMAVVASKQLEAGALALSLERLPDLLNSRQNFQLCLTAGIVEHILASVSNHDQHYRQSGTRQADHRTFTISFMSVNKLAMWLDRINANFHPQYQSDPASQTM